MKLAVIGAGYVGLVTTACLAQIGHEVYLVDIDTKKLARLKNGDCPIYEQGLQELLEKNKQNICYSEDVKRIIDQLDACIIAVGTPENIDGSVNLHAVEQVITEIALHAKKDIVIVLKSTVPVQTNARMQQLVNSIKRTDIHLPIVSNPEFLKEGTAIVDFFHGERIVLGGDDEEALVKIASMYTPLKQPIIKTDWQSAEMTKYAANAFLATKISFINEIATICEKVGADVEQVACGMGLDRRIGSQFLQAGIGYGGSCFPKDTKALIHSAGNAQHNFQLLKSVVEVNQHQKEYFVQKVIARLGSLQHKKISVLGLAFKANTDDVRESPAIDIIQRLHEQGANVIGYDPIATDNARLLLPQQVQVTTSIEEALVDAEAAIICTAWSEVVEIDVAKFHVMKNPLVFDGRNCYSLDAMKIQGIEYYSIGRAAMNQKVEVGESL